MKRDIVRRQSAIAQQAVPSGAKRLLNHPERDGSELSGGAAKAIAVSKVTEPIAMKIMLRIEENAQVFMTGEAQQLHRNLDKKTERATARKQDDNSPQESRPDVVPGTGSTAVGQTRTLGLLRAEKRCRLRDTQICPPFSWPSR